MNGISQEELLLLAGAWNALFALATVGILWNARCQAVYLWCASGLGGAAFSLANAGPWHLVVYDAIWGQWLIGVTVIGSAVCKMTAIMFLADRQRDWRSPRIVVLLLLAGVLLIPVMGLERLWFSFYVALCVGGLIAVLSREALRLGSSTGRWNARILAAIVGAQALVLVGGSVLRVSQGIDPFGGPTAAVPMSTVLWNFGAVLVNTSLFISLILDINLRQRDTLQESVVSLELARSRREEREHMLADMHDGLGAQLATARLKLERGEMSQPALADLVTECIADMHLMVDTLHGQHETLARALADYRVRLEGRLRNSDIRVSWRIKLDDAPKIAPKPLLQVLRIIQEVINNALKHAKASEILVSARHVEGRGFDIRIEDDGIGIDANVVEGRGLENLRRRAREVGANLTIERRGPGGGTRVALNFL